jgi:hypothetical protein
VSATSGEEKEEKEGKKEKGDILRMALELP